MDFWIFGFLDFWIFNLNNTALTIKIVIVVPKRLVLLITSCIESSVSHCFIQYFK
ncbi:hypothetical protein PALI_a3451 [Pseudoalteromonas aliena SW19]|uniref:Uncharacterized protein n=1 Tax=Pseudoalteromonas aliena SW19 TaxID=1314866 RepID=A0ABR9DTZ4_9GAMM|nr:hypothetical protein [Pseudoalteromonas aliena SW19]